MSVLVETMPVRDDLRLFANTAKAPSATESALFDWVMDDAKRQYSGTCPRQWYTALLNAAQRIANPRWRDLGDFPELLSWQLVAAHNAYFRTIEAHYVTEAPTHELRDKLKALKRQRKSGDAEWYEHIVELAWIEEELRERAIIAEMNVEGAV